MSDVAVSLTPPPIITATVNPSEIAVSVAAAPAIAVTIGPVAGAHNGLAGIQGGALNDYYHLTAAKYNILGLHESLTDLMGGLASEHYHLSAAQYAALGTGAHNDLTGIQGGSALERYHLTAAEHAALGTGAHNDLTGLQGGQAGQYYHLSAADFAARILGTGTLGYIPYFTGAQGIGNSNIFSTGIYTLINKATRFGAYNNGAGVLQIYGDLDIGKDPPGSAAQIRFWTYPTLNNSFDAYIQVQNYLLSFGNTNDLGDGYNDMILVQGGRFYHSTVAGRVFNIKGSVQNSGTAGYTGLVVDITEYSLGSGDNLLADLQIGGVSKYKVSNTGKINSQGVAEHADNAAAVAAGLAVGDFYRTSDALKVVHA